MKIHFDGVNFRSSSGPNTFATRLAKQLTLDGIELVDSGANADVSLVFIEQASSCLAKKVVQRLDGIWFKPSEFKTKNVGIKSLYDKADVVIWQSEFDKCMTTKWWGHPKSGAIIQNGIEIDPVEQITIPQLDNIRSSYDKIFVCSANWHPQKRLRANIEMFDFLRKTQATNSCLLIMGSNPDVSVTDPHIFYTGSQPPEVYLQVFAVANWMIHLAWADHCPNVVIESLSQGTPVICSDVGGTKELVKDFGLILKDKFYDFELADYDNPPTIDVTQVSSLPSKTSLGSHADIDIKNVAKNYIKLFEQVVDD